MLSTGFRLVIGSWKIMLMSLPRMARVARSSSARRSRPSKRMAPAILGRLRDQAQDRHGAHRFPAAALADDCQRLAFLHLKRHPVDGAVDAVRSAEMGL